MLARWRGNPMSSDLTLVVMAAGASRRYGRLKQTAPVGPNEHALIEYGLYDALRAGFSRFVFVIRRGIEQEFHAAVGSHVADVAEVSYVFQEVPQHREKPWGTGHAILSAAEALPGRFGVINADDFYGRRSFEILADALDGADSVLVGFRLDHTLSEHGTVTRGICRTDEFGRLIDVTETFEVDSSFHPWSGHELVSMNMWGFHRAFIDLLRGEWVDFSTEYEAEPDAEFYLPVAVTNLVASHHLHVQVKETPETWFGLTNPGDERSVATALERLTADRTYPRALWHRSPSPESR